jgi:hypothetical protein
MTALAWTAVFTAVLAVGAIVTSVFAIRAFGMQSAELEILQGQAGDQSETNKALREAAGLQAHELRAARLERKRAQAARVLVWLERPGADPRVTQAQRGDSRRARWL